MENKDNRSGRLPANIGIAVFFLSFFPLFWHVGTAIHGVNNGMELYGVEAVRKLFEWLFRVPVYPVCILYQLIFGFGYIARKCRRSVKIAAVAVPVVLIIGLQYPVMKHKFDERKLINDNWDAIVSYLGDKYNISEDMIDDIEVANYRDRVFSVYPTFFDGHFEVYSVSGSDNLINMIMMYDPEFMSQIVYHAEDYYDLPDNYDLLVTVDGLDFGALEEDAVIGDTHASVDYTITGIKVIMDRPGDAELLDILHEIYSEYLPGISDRMAGDNIIVYVRTRYSNEYIVRLDGPAAYIEAYPDSTNNSALIGETVYLDNSN